MKLLQEFTGKSLEEFQVDLPRNPLRIFGGQERILGEWSGELLGVSHVVIFLVVTLGEILKECREAFESY